MSDPHQREAALLVPILRLILAAAVLTAPVFLFAEGFEAKYAWRVAASNGACAVLCLGLLALCRRERARLAGALFVWGLMGLVGALAWFNGEPVHVNVINFALVAVLASAVGTRSMVAAVAALSSVEMIAIAWTRPTLYAGKDLAEARFESIAQFLPTYLVVVTILWLRPKGAASTHVAPR